TETVFLDDALPALDDGHLEGVGVEMRQNLGDLTDFDDQARHAGSFRRLPPGSAVLKDARSRGGVRQVRDGQTTFHKFQLPSLFPPKGRASPAPYPRAQQKTHYRSTLPPASARSWVECTEVPSRKHNMKPIHLLVIVQWQGREIALALSRF